MTSKFNLFITIISFYLLNTIKSAPRRQQQHVQLAEQPTGDTSREIRPEINVEQPAYISERPDLEILNFLVNQMSILQDERLENFINLLKIIRKNKKDILELFKSQGMFNQLFEFVEANLKRIQPEKKKSEKKNSKSWSEALIELKRNGFERVLESIDICQNLENSVFRQVLIGYCIQEVKTKCETMFEAAKIPIKVNLDNSINLTDKIFDDQELENVVFGKKRKNWLSFLDKLKGSKVLSRASSSSLSSVSSNLSCLSVKDLDLGETNE
uniref:Uncharacterized protein n=1 Tax=Meloidogyne enterolobii TaxID=390850 RepID=A0A6V7V5I3_MELEN|nr:unnamed protein product [Meloidogyne enterolobii]